MDSAPVSVNVHKPSVPVLWLDTSVGIKLAKIGRGENLQQIEIDRLRRLKDTALRLTRKGVLLCPQSDQREEYEAGRIEEEVSREFLQLSQGIRMIHRQGILDQQLFYAMQSYVSNANVITLPLSVFFFDDPVRKAETARRSRFVIGVHLPLPTELLDRRIANKTETLDKLERLRKDLNAKKVTYEEQLALERHGKADALFELCRRFAKTLDAKTTDPWAYLGASGTLQYLRQWKSIGGKPVGPAGLYQFLCSEHFNALPIVKIGCQLGAKILTSRAPIKSGDSMDLNHLSAVAPISTFLLTDRAMAKALTDLKIDAEWDLQVFSMSSVDDLLWELDKL